MGSTWRLALIPVVCLTVGACKFPGSETKAPTGQVVATVGGDEITLRDLRSEMGNATAPNPQARKAAEQAALANIVTRKILAQAAHEQGIDKTPEFAVQKQRADEIILVQALQNKVLAAVPPTSKEDAQRYVTDHPDTFAERKIFVLDQIRMNRPSDPAVIDALRPLKTLEQVENLLKERKIPYQRATGNLDSVGADPRLIEAILKLPPNEVFVVPNGETLLVNQVRETKTVPFAGDQTIAYATQVLTRQHAQEAVQRQFTAIVNKAKPGVKFNKDYAPTPAKAAAAAPPAGG